jgi:arylsulfatase A-like enzyme/tetratricopeptide (TPR) repeat protein
MKLKIFVLILTITLSSLGLYYYLSQDNEIKNVIIISMDTTRADHLSCYRFDKNTTPNIDALAADGVLFENTISPVPLTLPAHCSMMTGTFPFFHKVFANIDSRLSESSLTLAEVLQKKDFNTFAIIGASVLIKTFGLDQGFDHYDDDDLDHTFMTTVTKDVRSADEVSDIAIARLNEQKDQRFFMFLHYYDPHSPYEPPEPFKSKFAGDSYAGEIAYTDHCIGRVVDRLKTLGLYDSTLIVLVGDHGEMLGEHGEAMHAYYIYQSAIKVPLIFKLPGKSKARRVSQLSGIVDIVPTVCSLLGIDVPKRVQGEDISGLFDSESDDAGKRHLYLESRTATVYNANALFGVINDQYKYIQTTRPELYDVVNDPFEKNNIYESQRHRARLMQNELELIMQQSDDKIADDKFQVDSSQLESLQSLGYVSGAVYEGDGFKTEGDDPKDIYGFHIKAQKVGPLIRAKEYDKAKRLCREMIEERSDYYMSYYNLGRMAMTDKNYVEAAGYFQQVVDIKPGYGLALNHLGQAHMLLKDNDKAIEFFGKALEVKPDFEDAHFHLGQIYYQREQYDKAIVHCKEALKSDPEYTGAHLMLSMAYYATCSYQEGIDQLEKVLEYDPENTDALNSLAWTIATNEELSKTKLSRAIKCALKAVSLTKHKNAGFLDTLAVVYAASRDFDNAIAMAQRAISLTRGAGYNKLVGDIEGRLKLFRAGTAYYEDH